MLYAWTEWWSCSINLRASPKRRLKLNSKELVFELKIYYRSIWYLYYKFTNNPTHWFIIQNWYVHHDNKSCSISIPSWMYVYLSIIATTVGSCFPPMVYDSHRKWNDRSAYEMWAPYVGRIFQTRKINKVSRVALHHTFYNLSSIISVPRI